MLFIIILIVLLGILFGYFKIAKRLNILDKPNERSSHSNNTVRGGGIIFPIASVLWFLLFDFQYPFAIAGLILISVISFLDDVYALSRRLRMFVHILTVTLLYWQVSFFDLSWYYWLPGYIVFIGWINAFNFMDGINGITPIYSLVSLVSFLYISTEFSFVSIDLLLILSISVLIFTYFNARKRAKAFAGDVGSVSLAFLLGWFIVSLILFTQRIEYILFFAVYGIDSVFTIFHRLIKKENIFKAHRSHLYQYLANELEISHLAVSAIFSGLQASINIFVIMMIRNDMMDLTVFLGILLIFSAIYLIIRTRVIQAIT